MRTTLTIDDDIADALRASARLLDLPFKQVVNDALRRGMSPGRREAPSPEYRVVPRHSGFVPGIDPLKLNQINDQLDADPFSVPGAGLIIPDLNLLVYAHNDGAPCNKFNIQVTLKHYSQQ